MEIDSPYPQLSEDLFNAFKNFVYEREINHCDLYQTLLVFVGGIVRVTYNQGAPEFSDAQKIKLCSGLSETFNELMDLAIFGRHETH